MRELMEYLGKLCRTSVVAPLLPLLFTGCAAITNPIADGLPVRVLPPELLAKPVDDEYTIPLDLLGRAAPDVYRLAPDDVLGVFIDGVLGDKTVPPQNNVVQTYPYRDVRWRPASSGHPVTVREDGTIRLPFFEPIKVAGKTVGEAEDIVRDLYAKSKILPAGRERVVVTLMQQRVTQVVVLRQESPNSSKDADFVLAGAKRNTGHVIDLLGNENDVLHALAQTGGLPALDAYNNIIIFRNTFRNQRDRALLLDKLKALPPGANPAEFMGAGAGIIRIPVRRRRGQDLPFGPEDVVLGNGDVVFVEARDPELFYTAGLLPAGEHVLPRDYDLDVIRAITRVRGPLVNGAFSSNQLAGNIIAPGIGSPSPAMLTVIRRTWDGGTVPIRVDLDRALQDPRERILVRAGDVLVLQERPNDAVSRYVTQTLVNTNIIWQAIRTSNVTGIIDLASPDRLGGRGLSVTQQ